WARTAASASVTTGPVAKVTMTIETAGGGHVAGSTRGPTAGSTGGSGSTLDGAPCSGDRPGGRDVDDARVVGLVLTHLEAHASLPVVVRMHLGVIGERDGQVVDT